ncbi:MAG: N-acetyl-gamma-glutamyl-phosphate reductase [Chromatiales bacterium]|nr:N-acetyl-gamma-glutamyl-phosphate reductase [Chromatiales bacterium]
MAGRIPALVLGGSGYVAGELLRLISLHPHLELAGVMSDSQAGQPLRHAFPHLQGGAGSQRFAAREELLGRFSPGRLALFSAAPHGASAELIAGMIRHGEAAGSELTIVDVSADFRFADADAYAKVYRHPHGAPELLDRFACALPEHLPGTPRPFVGHPGCFSTAMLLAAVPLLSLGLAGSDLHAVGITGSTGSGRSPGSGTHHPERHSNLYAYQPLRHRHAPEVVGICARLTGARPALHFVPHSGPFARGIYLTLQTRLARPAGEDTVREQIAGFYAGQPFVEVVDGMPRIKAVAGSNYANIGVSCDGEQLAVMVVIDNLVKGAAGGAMQWMNRLLGWPEETGLTAPALGWT